MTAATVFVWAGVKYIIGSSAGSTSSAKESMTNAVIGLVLLISSVAILRTVNPATVRYDKLDIFMINKIVFSDDFFCREVKPKNASKPLMFADSGDPSGKIAYDAAKFELPVDETLCGKEYYPESFVGRRCVGSKCPEKGKVCLSCKGGYDECGEQKEGYACVKAVMAGNVSWTDDTHPKKVYLLGICNFIQPASGQKFNSDNVANSVPTALDVDLTAVSGEAGSAGYVYGGGASDLAALQSACASRGGLRGVVLGVTYKDNDTSAVGVAAGAVAGGGYGAAAGGAAGLAFSAGVFSIPGAVIGGAIGAGVGAVAGSGIGPNLNDIAIITKKDCGNTGTAPLSAYADGTALSFDSTDMKTAIYCGARIVPGSRKAETFNSTFYQNNMWSPEELTKAFNGEAIDCDFGLTKNNAPPDPGTVLMGGCQADWCPAAESECTN